MRRLRIHPGVAADIKEAVIYYRDNGEDLKTAFLTEIYGAMDIALESPLVYPILDHL